MVLVAQFVTVVPEFVMTWHVLPLQAVKAIGEDDVMVNATWPLVRPADASPAVPSTPAVASTTSASVVTAERIILRRMRPPFTSKATEL